MNVNKWICIVKSKSYLIVLLAFWVFYSAVILHESYVVDVFISPDSSMYLREADAIRNGYGFNFDGMAGGDSWFADWPIGYPALIALVSFFLPGRNVYLCSKVLTILLVGIELIFFGKHFREKSWVYALILLDFGILRINYYAWSETVLMPVLLLFSYELSRIVTDVNAPRRCYIVIALLMITAFLVRYFGMLTILASLVSICFLAIHYCLKKEHHTPSNKRRILRFLAATSVSVIFVIIYLLINTHFNGYPTGVARAVFSDDIAQLTAALFQSIADEVQNALLVADEHPLFKYLNFPAQVLLSIGMLVMLVFFLVKRRKIDEPAVFILIGLFYYCVFIAFRYHSTMDTFNSRFFAPASMLILIGLVSIIWEKIGAASFKMLEVAIAFMLVIATGSIVATDWGMDKNETAYKKEERSVISLLNNVPARTVVLEYMQSPDKGARAQWFREDLIYSGTIEEQETIEQLKDRYKANGHVCINKEIVANIILPDASGYYSESLRSYFREALKGLNSSQKYIVIQTR